MLFFCKLKHLTRDELVALAKHECEKEGLADGLSQFTYRTNSLAGWS